MIFVVPGDARLAAEACEGKLSNIGKHVAPLPPDKRVSDFGTASRAGLKKDWLPTLQLQSPQQRLFARPRPCFVATLFFVKQVAFNPPIHHPAKAVVLKIRRCSGIPNDGLSPTQKKLTQL